MLTLQALLINSFSLSFFFPLLLDLSGEFSTLNHGPYLSFTLNAPVLRKAHMHTLISIPIVSSAYLSFYFTVNQFFYNNII